MDGLTSKMDGVTVEEAFAAAEADLALAPELARTRGMKAVPGSARTAAVGETI